MMTETVDDFFAGHDAALAIFAELRVLIGKLGPSSLHVGKSQIAFRRRRTFAMVWRPGQYLGGRTAPLVLTLALPYRDPSPRWKQIVEPAPGHFTHHLELWAAGEVDAEVAGLLASAYRYAG